jgi:hypothetical protein
VADNEERSQWKAISGIQESLNEIKVLAARIEEKLEAHIKDPVIHTRPPCDHYKVLTNRVWAVCLGVAVALIGAAGAIIAAVVK